MERVRRPFFIISIILFAVAFLVELGGNSLLHLFSDSAAGVENALQQALAADNGIIPQEVKDGIAEAQEEDIDASELEQLADKDSPGIGIRYLALVDAALLFSLALITAGIFLPGALQGKLQGIVTLVFGLILLILTIFAIIAALVKLLIMVGMLLAVPFGTLAYLAIYGHFPRGTAAAILGVLMTIKLLGSGSLLLGHLSFLKNKWLVLLILSSLLAGILVAFLHGIVPGILASITDALAAIIVGILAAIWAIVFIITGITSIVSALTSEAA